MLNLVKVTGLKSHLFSELYKPTLPRWNCISNVVIINTRCFYKVFWYLLHPWLMQDELYIPAIEMRSVPRRLVCSVRGFVGVNATCFCLIVTSYNRDKHGDFYLHHVLWRYRIPYSHTRMTAHYHTSYTDNWVTSEVCRPVAAYSRTRWPTFHQSARRELGDIYY